MDEEQKIIIEFSPGEAKAIYEMIAGLVNLPFSPPDVRVRWGRLAEKINQAITFQSNGVFFQCSACHEK